MSNPSGSNWTTNVNRAKTKRWVEAKSFSYDGDDWGDADEYGEYDEPKVASKPTGLRKATAPASSTNLEQDPAAERDRANSFGRGDERRAFSGPTRTAYAQPQPSQPQPAAYSQEQAQSSQWSQNTPSQAGLSGRTPFLNQIAPQDGRTGSMVSNSSAPISGRRKPSMGQADQPPSVAPILTNIPPPAIGTPDKPSTPTFIRPADIYRRVQEEREKERLSQESSRPSLSGLTRDESPAGKSEKSGKQAHGPAFYAATQINTAPTIASSSIEAPNVAPRTAVAAAAAPPTTATTKSYPNPDTRNPDAMVYGGRLPEITGLSGFGDDFGSSFLSSTEPVKKTTSASTATTTGPPTRAAETLSPNVTLNDSGQEPNLHHQSSFGYKSVVNQAFDQAVPPTPSTTSGSGVDRSNSDSTNNISPIISREVSSAVRPEGISNISAITEEPAGWSRPGTSGSNTKRKSGGTQQNETTEQSPIIPGHRRDTSLPSANNSPARTPALENKKELMMPQEAEVTATTPASDNRSPVRKDRSLSPAKNRVRDLVDKIDSGKNSRRGSEDSFGDKADLLQPQRPTIEPKESFRPSLPGAWASYTTNQAPVQAPETTRSTHEAVKETTSQSPVQESNEDAFAKAAAAGSALAGAFTAAAAITAAAVVKTTSSAISGFQPEETEIPNRASKVDTAFHPEAARLALPRTDSDGTSSIMATPLDMKPGAEQESEYFGSVQPLQPSTRLTPDTTLIVPQGKSARPSDDMSTKSSPTDLESDRLRKEIVRELSPKRDDVNQTASQEPQSSATENEGGYSSIYDSYLDEDEDGPGQKNGEGEKTLEGGHPLAEQKNAFSEPQQESSQPMFSSTSGPLEDVPESAAVTEVTHSLTRAFSWETPMEILPLDDFRSSGKKKEVTESEPETNPPAASHEDSPSQPLDLNKQLPPPITTDDQESLSEQSDELPRQQMIKQESSDTVLPTQPTNKVPAFREIMAMPSVPERIQVYDQTRQTFANMDTGLLQWIQSTINALPEHEELLRNGGVFPVVFRPPLAAGAQSSQGTAFSSRPSFGPSTGKNTKGIFGSKTSSAAKGLFAKSKSRWRGGADKASKRLRGLSLSSNSEREPPSKLYQQQPNLWETDATAPYLGDHPIPRKAISKESMPGIDDTDSQVKQPNDIQTIDSLPANSISPPTTVHLDSPTLGRSNTTGGPISPLSGRTSFERKRLSLAQKRASMEVPGSARMRAQGHRHRSSYDSHRYASKSRESIERRLASTEAQARLTIHQNQMRSFGEEFPSDLIIPAEYRIPTNSEQTPKLGGETSTEQTPTQADFPKEILDKNLVSTSPIAEEEIKKSERKAAPSALWLDTTGTSQDHTFDGPASPDYALRPQEDPEGDGADQKPLYERSDAQKHFSSLSFIQFDPITSEDLALNVPITPKRSSIFRESSDTGEGSLQDTQDSESSFADYPAAEDFGALPSESSIASPTNEHERSSSINSHSQQTPMKQPKLSRRTSESSRSTNSRSSVVGRPAQQVSRQPDETSINGPTIANQDSSVVQDSMRTDSANTLKRHSMLSDVRESRELYPNAKENRQQNRKSLLGLGLSMKGADNSSAKTTRGPKFSLIPSSRKRTGTNLSNYEADPSQPSLTPDSRGSNMQRAATTALTAEKTNLNTGAGINGEKGKKKRFSGLSSFINRAKPRVGSVSNSIRGRSPTPLGTITGSKLDSTPELRENDAPATSKDNLSIGASQHQSQHQRTISRDTDGGSTMDSDVHLPQGQLVTPAAQIRNYTSIPDITSNQDAIMNKVTAPPEHNSDYKSVYPPEFFGEQPPEGYYGPEEDPETEVKRVAAAAAAAATTAKNADTNPVQPSDAVTEAENADNTPEPIEPRASANKQHGRFGSEDSSPPPPPPKDPPKHSVTTTTTTTHTLKGPTRTITEVQTELSQQAHYESRLRGRSKESPRQDYVVTTNIIPASPIVHMATSKTVTKIANGRSVSPRARNNRSSVPIVPPLNILKKISGSRRDEQDGVNDLQDSVDANGFEGSSQHRSATPHLTLNTQTGPKGPVPIEQFSETSKATDDLDVTADAPPPAKTPSHPFIARRATSALNQVSTPPSNEDNAASSPRAFDETRHNNNVDKIESPIPRMLQEPDRGESKALDLNDPVMIVRPLTIRKSPDLGNRRSPDQVSQQTPKVGKRKSPNLSQRDDYSSPFNKAPETPLPPVPKRISLHSPVLKDSPTLPRPTPPQSTAMSPARIPSAIILPKRQTTQPLAQPITPPPSKQTSTEDKEVVQEEPPPISPLPRKPATPTSRAMTPVEKMKDEPRVNEVAKESDESEDEIVMSSTAYPGQEWRPDYGYGGWDGYE